MTVIRDMPAEMYDNSVIAAARLDASEMEWQRHYRVWRCAIATLELCEKDLLAMAQAPFTPKVDELESIAERLTGLNDLLSQWLKSPKEMAELRKR